MCVDSATIAALLRPYAELSSKQLEQTSIYLDLLLKWNAKVNLTAVRKPEEIITRHFGESFFAARMLFPQPLRERVVDLGSGAGFPGLPLAIFVPELGVTLIESNLKKAAFLNEVIRTLALNNAKVFSQRAETYADTADVVTMRAVEKFEKVLPVALGLIREGGRIALMIGASQLGGLKALAGEVEWQEPWRVPGGASRMLVQGIKQVIVG